MRASPDLERNNAYAGGLDADEGDSDTGSSEHLPRTAPATSSCSWKLRALSVAGALGCLALVCVLAAPSDSGRTSHDAMYEKIGSSAGFQLQQAYAEHIPVENLTDNNPCNPDEEFFEGLCYSRCSTLSDGKHPYRQSAWVCCEFESCVHNPLKIFSCCKHDFGFCTGFDVAGQREGSNKCPHKVGVCLTNEELFYGLCYKTCNALTGGKYPHRTGPESCCMQNDVSCLFQKGFPDGLNGQSKIDPNFAVGGGCSDTSNLTHCHPHLPQLSLAEA